MSSGSTSIPDSMQSIFESHGISIQLQPQDDDDDPEWQPDDDDDDEAYEDEDEEIEVDRSAFPMNDTPNETGIHLMDSGDFGRVGVKRDNRGFVLGSPTEEAASSSQFQQQKQVYAQRSVARRILDESSLRRATLFREDYTSVSGSPCATESRSYMPALFSLQSLVPNTVSALNTACHHEPRLTSSIHRTALPLLCTTPTSTVDNSPPTLLSITPVPRVSPHVDFPPDIIELTTFALQISAFAYTT